MLFWIAIYCLHADRCYVSQSDGPNRYPTQMACEAARTGGIEVHRNTGCFAVKDVGCFNGGSVCSFTPGDAASADKLKSMVAIPK